MAFLNIPISVNKQVALALALACEDLGRISGDPELHMKHYIARAMRLLKDLDESNESAEGIPADHPSDDLD